MKNYLIYFYIILIFQACGCKEGEAPQPEPPAPQEISVFDLEWATRMDFEKEIVNLADGEEYGDWFLYPGDNDDPLKVLAFNKETGEKAWEYIHSGAVQSTIITTLIYNDIYLGMGSKGIVAIDLISQTSIWEIDFDLLDFTHGFVLEAYNGHIYSRIRFGHNTSSQSSYFLKIDPNTGSFEPLSTFAIPSGDLSPLVFYEDINTGETSIIFNEYPDNGQPPTGTVQHIKRVDVSTGEVLWQQDSISNFFASNVLHPPVIYEDIVITGGDWSIYAFDIHTGEQLWRREFEPFTYSIWNTTNHLLHEDRLYVNNTGTDISCLNPQTGALIWSNPTDASNCTDNMLYYEKEDYLVYTSWGFGSVMILDALTGQTIHREHRYDNSSYNNDVVYDADRDMFFSCTYKHAVGFKVNRP